MLLIPNVVVISVRLFFMFNVKTETRGTYVAKNRLIYHNQTSLQRLFRNKRNIQYFTCDN